MFVYSFLEKNLACAILFETVRLLFFEVPRLSFFDIPKKQNCFIIINCSPHSFTNFSDDWWGSHSVLSTFRSFFLTCAIISSCAFINFWRISGPDYFILFVYSLLKSTQRKLWNFQFWVLDWWQAVKTRESF